MAYTCGPVYGGVESASGILEEIATTIEGGSHSITVSPADAKAIRWALDCVEALREMKEWPIIQQDRPFIEHKLMDGVAA